MSKQSEMGADMACPECGNLRPLCTCGGLRAKVQAAPTKTGGFVGKERFWEDEDEPVEAACTCNYWQEHASWCLSRAVCPQPSQLAPPAVGEEKCKPWFEMSLPEKFTDFKHCSCELGVYQHEHSCRAPFAVGDRVQYWIGIQHAIEGEILAVWSDGAVFKAPGDAPVAVSFASGALIRPPAKRVVKQVEYTTETGSKCWSREQSVPGWHPTGRTHSYEDE